MKHENNFKILIIMAIVIAIVAVTLGYAGLSQVLNITTSGTVQSQATSWNVKFTNAGAGSVTGSATKGSISLNNTTVTVTGVVLKAPGDTVTWTWDVTNAGQVPAKVSTFTNLTPTVSGASADVTTVNSNYTYAITYSDGVAPKANDALAAGATKSMKLVITYKSTATTLPSANVTISNLGATLTYVQA